MSNAVPEGWSEDVIGSYVADSVAGEWGSEADGGDDDIPVLRATNFSESGAVDYRKLAIRSVVEKKRLKKSLQRGDIVLEKSGGSPTQPVGRVIYFDNDQPFLYSNFTQKLTPVSGCDSKYLFYKLYFEYQNGTVLKFQQQTTGIINFQLAEYLLFKSVFPPLPEQQKIAAILSSVDDVIEKTQAQIDKLKDLKTGMMQELLTKGIGHTEFKDSPVGRIPVGWDSLTIRDLVKFTGGSQPPRDTFIFEPRDGYVRLLQIRDYKTDRFETYIPEELSRRWCDEDDIMIGRYGPPIFQILRGKKGSYNVALIKASPSDSRLDKGYLYHFLCRRDLFQLIDSYSQRTSGQTGIDMDALNDFGFPLPSLNEQKEIASKLDHMDYIIGVRTSKLESVKNTKKALMQDLLTGTVRVKVD